MRGLFYPSVLAIFFATAAPAPAQEYWDQKILGADTDEQEELEDDAEMIDEVLDEEAEIANSVNPEETNELNGENAVREKAAAIIGFAVFDSDGKKLGKVANVVMRDDAAALLIVKLDSLFPNNRLLRAVSFGDAKSESEGRVVRLPVNKSELRKQSHFFYVDDMETIVPVTKAAERTTSQTDP